MGNSSSPGVKSKLSHLGSGGRGENYDSNGRLQELMSMGFSEADSRASLNAAKGNVQVATNYLLNSKMGGKASVGADQNADLEMQRALQLSLAGGGGGGGGADAGVPADLPRSRGGVLRSGPGPGGQGRRAGRGAGPIPRRGQGRGARPRGLPAGRRPRPAAARGVPIH
mmetsp:Transcript_131763/g.299602  ORF Transcript_131763/g.299602 Transcript_131763/m.299602 type:complete len:169 (+) Transcript_131763:77-583(+)